MFPLSGTQYPLPALSPEGGCSLLSDRPALAMALRAVLSLKTWSGGSPAMGEQMGFGEQTALRAADLLCFQAPVGTQTGTSTPAAESAVCQSRAGQQPALNSSFACLHLGLFE